MGPYLLCPDIHEGEEHWASELVLCFIEMCVCVWGAGGKRMRVAGEREGENKKISWRLYHVLGANVKKMLDTKER